MTGTKQPTPSQDDRERAHAAWRSISWGTQMFWSAAEVDKVIEAFASAIAAVRTAAEADRLERDKILYSEGRAAGYEEAVKALRNRAIAMAKTGADLYHSDYRETLQCADYLAAHRPAPTDAQEDKS